MSEQTYPCANCGMLRTKAEGGTVFTVCDDCWNILHPAASLAPNPIRDPEAMTADLTRQLKEAKRSLRWWSGGASGSDIGKRVDELLAQLAAANERAESLSRQLKALGVEPCA